MNRRQFVGAAVLPLVGGSTALATVAPTPKTPRQFARVFSIILNKPLKSSTRFDTPRQILLASYNKTDDFALETYPLTGGGLGEFIALRRDGAAVTVFAIDTEMINLGVPSLRSFENKHLFIAIGGDISDHWRRIKAENPWMHPARHPGFRVVEDRAPGHPPDCTVLTWTNDGSFESSYEWAKPNG